MDLPGDDEPRAWRAVADWQHAAFTGLVLAAIVRCGTPRAAALVERVFARQREALFLPGLRKLGLDALPHADACARYHYLSNDVGGVAVQYLPESDRKAWVRYVAPRWIWAGTALCAVPDEITAAMLRGWHAGNGVSLGNPRLGFVCTRTTTAGDDCLEGYYLEHDRPLAPHERLRFAREERGPAFDPARAPVLASASWPPGRLAKARRNYAMAYLRTALPAAIEVLGEDEAVRVVGVALRQVGLQHYLAACEALGLPAQGDAAAFAAFLVAMARGQGDAATVREEGREEAVREAGGDAAVRGERGEAAVRGTCGRVVVDWPGPRLLAGDDGAAPHPAIVAMWRGLWDGALGAHDRGLVLRLAPARDEARGGLALVVERAD